MEALTKVIWVLYERGLSLVLGWDILESFPGYIIYCYVYLRICIHNRCYLKLNNCNVNGVMWWLLCYGLWGVVGMLLELCCNYSRTEKCYRVLFLSFMFLWYGSRTGYHTACFIWSVLLCTCCYVLYFPKWLI